MITVTRRIVTKEQVVRASVVLTTDAFHIFGIMIEQKLTRLCRLGLCLVWSLTASAIAAQSKQPLPPTSLEQRTGHKTAPPLNQARFALPDDVRLEDGVTEDEAVAIALWNNATLHADLSVLGLARADLLDAGLLRNPILNLVLPIGPYRQFESALNFPLEVFWQRRKRVEAATVEVNRVAQSLEQNALNLIRDVRLAYTDWTFAVERVRLADEAVDWRQQTVKLINVRLRVGDIGEIEATAARLDQSLAVEQTTRLRREIVLARDRLRQLLGASEEPTELKLPQQKSLVILASFKTDEQVTATAAKSFEEILQAALSARPELRAAEIAIETAAKRAQWEHSRLVTLAGLLNLKQGEGVGFSPRPGIVAELPIFNRNQGGIARADAEVERASWLYLAARQRIANEVRDAFNQYWQARETLAQWQTNILPPAETNVQLSEAAFKSGDQSYLFVLDALRRRTEIQAREVDLQAELRRAIVQLDRSIGRKFDAKP